MLVKALLTTLLAVSANAAACYQTLKQADFPNCALLESRYALHWNVAGDHITYGVTVDVDVASAWIGLGVSDNGGMRGADITVLTTDQAGKIVAQDYWAENYGPPQLDAAQDVSLDASKSSQANGQTTAVFSRPLNSCDPQDQAILANTSHSVIWAIGSSATLSYHAPENRGDSKVTFIPDLSAPAIKDPSDLTLLKMFFDNYTVPANQSTTYTCVHKAFAPPPSSANGTKFHVTRFEGVAQNKHVHHMIVYGCNKTPKTFNTTYDCLSMDTSCTDVLFVWAPGVSVVDMPPEAGFPIGTAADAYQAFSLQIHYTNAESDHIVDSSGFNVWYTAVLRQYDMGVIFLGQESINIPGDTALVTIPSGYCPGDCTKRLPHPITVQNNFFHMHTLGQNLTTRHIRDGVELEPLGTRRYYDFNHQGSSRPFGGPRQILPGDSLITTCTYSSLGRKNATVWSEDTSGEMCYNIIQYYPRVKMNWCTSTPYDVIECANVAELNKEADRLFAQNQTRAQLYQTLTNEGYFSTSKLSDLQYTPYKDGCASSLLNKPTEPKQNSGVTSAPSLAVVGAAIWFAFGAI